MYPVDDLQDPTEWAPVVHQGGELAPPMWADQPCNQPVLYIRKSPIVVNAAFSALDMAYPNGEAPQKGELIVCRQCGADMLPDIQRVVYEIQHPGTQRV
jgi:hypothetical protein